MATEESKVSQLEQRVKNLELFVIGILKAFQGDGRVDPRWLEEVRGCLDTDGSSPPRDGEN